jgi:hypothetical protein
MIKNKFNKIVKDHDNRMHRIANLEKRQQWSNLYNEAVKLIEEIARLEEDKLNLQNRIDMIGRPL